MLFGTVALQAALGIFTLLLHTPLALALTHQAGAMLVLTVATVHAARLAERAPRVVAVPGAVVSPSCPH